MKHIPVLFVCLLGAACSQDKPAPEAPAPAPAAQEAPAPAAEQPAAVTFASQVEAGGALFGQHCAKCHGASGQGTDKAPPLVGEGALPLDPPATAKHRKGQFKTALDVFNFVKANMPADAPGSLTDEQYVQILAFDLKANGVELEQPLTAAVAAGLELH